MLGFAAIAGSTLVSSCRAPTDNEAKAWEGPCPQTYEFGNYGCARFVILADFGVSEWPGTSRGFFGAILDGGSVGSSAMQLPPAGEHVVRLIVTDFAGYSRSPAADSIWLRGTVIDHAGPIVIGGGPQVLARDSVRRAMRWTAVGTRPVVDTVRLTFRRS